MNPPKTPDHGSTRSTTTTSTSATAPNTRKPWKKRSPIDVVIDQIEKERDSVAQKEEELKQAKKQLEKLEQAKELLESA